MARNEEKQLARLNRWYLQKQRDEEIKKRPPRPKLESVTTSEELRKWIPSITKDIEFYAKQMEVTCYGDHHIEEFSKRIGHLKGEYKAFLRKLRELDPEDKITPWTDRPYAKKRRKVSSSGETDGSQDLEFSNADSNKDLSKTSSPSEFVPLQAPILDSDEDMTHNFGYERTKIADCPDLSHEDMNQPLQFASSRKPVTPNNKWDENTQVAGFPNSSDERMNQPLQFASSPESSVMKVVNSPDEDVTNNQIQPSSVKTQCVLTFSQPTESCMRRKLSDSHCTVLNLPYSDSSSSGDET